MIPLFSANIANAGLDLLSAIKRVLDRHWYVLGEEVANFETEFAEYIGAPHCATVANGTDALELALRAVGVGNGDQVATVANAGFYSTTAIRATGALPLYVDIDPLSMNMSPAQLIQILDQRPKAVIVTHLYGQLAAIESIRKITQAAGIPLIEDCAQAHGAACGGQRAGSFGDAACFSFYPKKNLGALGDGGAVVSQNAAIDARVRALRQYGWSSKYTVTTAYGRNSRLDEIQAAILRLKLPFLDTWNTERRAIAAAYNEAFMPLPRVTPPVNGEDCVAHLYVIRIDSRDEFREFLKMRDIATDVHYPMPDHLQPAYPGAGSLGSLPETERASARVVTLPCFPGLTSSEIDRIIVAVRAFSER